MIGVTLKKQLNTFDTIKSILKTSTILKTKFKDKDYYEFEPSLKSLKQTDIPYIVIPLPETETEEVVMNHSSRLKNFNIIITLVVDYMARDKYKTFANAIIDTLESNKATLEKNGYYDLMIDFIGANDELIDNLKVISGQFELSLTGNIVR